MTRTQGGLAVGGSGALVDVVRDYCGGEVLAANAFAGERKAYFEALAGEADLLRTYLGMEDAGDVAAKRCLGLVWALAFTRSRLIAKDFETVLFGNNTRVRDVAAKRIAEAIRPSRGLQALPIAAAGSSWR